MWCYLAWYFAYNCSANKVGVHLQHCPPYPGSEIAHHRCNLLALRNYLVTRGFTLLIGLGVFLNFPEASLLPDSTTFYDRNAPHKCFSDICLMQIRHDAAGHLSRHLFNWVCGKNSYFKNLKLLAENYFDGLTLENCR